MRYYVRSIGHYFAVGSVAVDYRLVQKIDFVDFEHSDIVPHCAAVASVAGLPVVGGCRAGDRSVDENRLLHQNGVLHCTDLHAAPSLVCEMEAR